jgi:hypothetical protein
LFNKNYLIFFKKIGPFIQVLNFLVKHSHGTDNTNIIRTTWGLLWYK